MTCNAQCLTCFGPTNYECTTCSTILTTHYFFNSADKSCLGFCPAGFIENPTTNRCDACSGCKTCIGTVSKCSSCSTGSYLNEITAPSSPTCVGNLGCPKGSYPNAVLNYCSLCADPCAECSTAGSTSCTECRAVLGTQYYLFSTSCITECPVGFWKDLTGLPKCTNCNQDPNYCLTCTDAASCTSCPSGRFLDLATSKCELSCAHKGNYYGNSTSNKCEKCDLACATCTG